MNYRIDTHWSHSTEGFSCMKIAERLWTKTSLAPQWLMEPNSLSSSIQLSPLSPRWGLILFCPFSFIPSAILITRKGEKNESFSNYFSRITTMWSSWHVSPLPCSPRGCHSPLEAFLLPLVQSLCAWMFLLTLPCMWKIPQSTLSLPWIYQAWCHWPALGTRVHDRFCI